MSADNVSVTIKPLSSAFFAGETLTVHITFTNRNVVAPSPSAAARRRTPQHKTTQSLAVPRTPATAPPEFLAPRLSLQRNELDQSGIRTPLSASFAALPKQIRDDMVLPTRKGLIGRSTLKKGLEPLKTTALYPSKRLPSSAHRRQNYSVALQGSQELDDLSAQQVALSYQQQDMNGHAAIGSTSKSSLHEQESINVSPISSTTHSPDHTKTRSLSALSNHDPMIRSFSQSSEYDFDNFTPRSSVDFYGAGKNESMDSVLRDSMTDWMHPYHPNRPIPNRKPSIPISRRVSAISSTSTSSANPSGRETLLWAFAQLQGSFEVDETLIKPAEFVAVKRSIFGHPSLPSSAQNPGARAGLIGGGTLNTPASSSDNSSWRDWLWSTSAPSQQVFEPINGTRKSPALSVAGGAQSGGTLAERWTRAFSDKSIPVFSVPPSVFAVDLVLEPGQSKTFSYSLRLPGDLPPSFKGRSIKFVYDLIVGTNKASASDSIAQQSQQKSRLLHLPLRIYNNVSESGARPFYDLTNPIVWFKDEAETALVADEKIALPATQPFFKAGRSEFDAYSNKLLAAVYASPEIGRSSNVPDGFVLSPTMQDWAKSPSLEYHWGPANRHEMQRRSSMTKPTALEAEDDVTACAHAIEMVSRTSQKASFDINKDGYLVASVTFIKSAFRLGETVFGSVALNRADARVLRVSARLESHELIETTISVRKVAQVRHVTRRMYAEHNEVVLDSGRTMLSLPIPSGATPDFATSGVKLQWSVRLAFLVIPPAAPAELPKSAQSVAASSTTRPSHARNLSGVPGASSQNRVPSHGRSQSYSFSTDTRMVDPVPVHTGTHHIMPIPSACSDQHTSYRAVPDLSFGPVLFQSAEEAIEAAQSPKIAHQRSGSGSFSPSTLWQPELPAPEVNGSVVLMPGKTETIECSIPIKVYPTSTPFLPSEVSFRL